MKLDNMNAIIWHAAGAQLKRRPGQQCLPPPKGTHFEAPICQQRIYWSVFLFTNTHTHGWKGPRTVWVGTGVPAVTATQKDSRPGVAWATLVEVIVIQYGHVGLLEKSLKALSCRLKKNHPV